MKNEFEFDYIQNWSDEGYHYNDDLIFEEEEDHEEIMLRLYREGVAARRKLRQIQAKKKQQMNGGI